MKLTIGMIGNPNCGKTTLFNALTGGKQTVGNWPGVTVEKKTGSFKSADKEIEVVDLPGIYSMSSTSLDEKVATEFLQEDEYQLVVNIVDASNLERNFYLTTQLKDMQVPLVIVANMMDITKKLGVKINFEQLENDLGVKVIPFVANQKGGVAQLRKDLAEYAAEEARNSKAIEYDRPIEEKLTELGRAVEKVQGNEKFARWKAISLLMEEDTDVELTEALKQKMLSVKNDMETKYEDDIDILLADARFSYIRKIISRVQKKKCEVTKTLSDKIDAVVLNRWLGIPLFLAAMYAVFMVTINVGGAFIDFFDIFVGAIAVDGLKAVLETLNTPAWLVTLLADGIGGGIQTVATFIPPIFFMFISLSILEDSGYMARVAFVMDRFMRFIGLPGKAIVPMLVGFGCTVPAVMATRTLDSDRDRKLAIMMSPFMSCGARLPVYALFAAAFFPTNGQNVVFLLYIIGIVLAILTGLLLKSTVLKGQASAFIMELPAYHIPSVKNVMIKAYGRLQSFISKAGKMIILVVLALSFLNSMGTDGSFGNEDTDKSILASIGKTITPVFEPMGIMEENWPATVGLFTGIFAKEVIVGTLDSLYDSTAAAQASEDAEEAFDLSGSITDAFNSIPEGLAGVLDTFGDPMGMNIGDVSDQSVASEELEVAVGTFGTMVARFGGTAAAFSYLLFILIYFPCVAAIAAVYRETNLSWTVFNGTYLTVLAWTVSTGFYQAATFNQHPVQSLIWLSVLAAAVAGFVILLKTVGAKALTEKRVIQLNTSTMGAR
jgi:ferrous iron transport protein B